MDLRSLGNYYIWAENRIQSQLNEFTDSEFELKHEGMGRSLRDLAEHLYVAYESHFHSPTTEIWNKLSEKAKGMSRIELIENWINATQRFVNDMADNDKPEMTLPINIEKSLKLDKDNYFFLYTDHQTYHRAQMVSLMKIMGNTGVGTDYYEFITS